MEPALRRSPDVESSQPGPGAAAPSRGRAVFKFVFWLTVAIGLFAYAWQTHASGQLAAWYYHRAAEDGYAVDADAFKNATPKNPALLAITTSDRIDGLMAVKVKKGDLLPKNANGVITADVIKAGKRVQLEGDVLRVKVPWEIKQSKGFKYKDAFKHKGVETYPWGAVWNVVMVIGLGLALGFLAEGFTDVLGMRLEKIRHFEGH
jgi:hypothetical protein